MKKENLDNLAVTGNIEGKKSRRKLINLAMYVFGWQDRDKEEC